MASRRRNPSIAHPDVVYHGTQVANLPGILRARALTPKGGYSPHATKSPNYTFVTPDLGLALFYGPVILELDPQGQPLEPDYDDIADALEVHLDELENQTGQRFQLGQPLDDEEAQQVEEAIEILNDGERATPMLLEVMNDDGIDYLIAQPYVSIQIDDSAERYVPELYDDPDISFDDGAPVYIGRQYMCKCAWSAEKILAFWLGADVAKEYGIDLALATEQDRLTDYSNVVVPLDEDGEPLEYAMRALMIN